MVSSKDVQILNKKIEIIMQQKVKAETQQEMLKKRLSQELTEYSNQFGVSLQGKTFTSTRKLIIEETKKVTSEVEAEFALKEKVVSAIESGDINTAYALLGIEVKKEVEPEPEVEPEAIKLVEEAPVELDITSEDFSFCDLEDEDLEEADLGDLEEEVKVPVKDAKAIFDSFGFDEDIIEEEEAETPKSSVKPVMTSAKEAFADLVVEDEKEDDLGLGDLDLGFGDMLKGTKFEG